MNHKSKWYLSDFNLNVTKILMSDWNPVFKKFDERTHMMSLGYTKQVYMRGKSFLIFDNGGEIIIKGIGFKFDRCIPLPDGNEEILEHRLMNGCGELDIDYDYKGMCKEDFEILYDEFKNKE